jgi:SAM-dependent methyltransferase
MDRREEQVVDAFGREWAAFDHAASTGEIEATFAQYFRIFPWDQLPDRAEGFDLGCGSGRWARLVAPRVGALTCIDASTAAVAVASRNLAHLPNCRVVEGRAGALPLRPASMDFGYALGVLHHLADPPGALRDAVSKLRPGAPFLVYVYYTLDGRPLHYRLAWRAADAVRRVVSRLPHTARRAVAEVAAVAVYYPFARTARWLEARGRSPDGVPLAPYRDRSLYMMRTDSLDRFGTSVERRYTRAEAIALMTGAGLERVRVSDSEPYWCLLGYAPRATTSLDTKGLFSDK